MRKLRLDARVVRFRALYALISANFLVIYFSKVMKVFQSKDSAGNAKLSRNFGNIRVYSLFTYSNSRSFTKCSVRMFVGDLLRLILISVDLAWTVYRDGHWGLMRTGVSQIVDTSHPTALWKNPSVPVRTFISRFFLHLTIPLFIKVFRYSRELFCTPIDWSIMNFNSLAFYLSENILVVYASNRDFSQGSVPEASW